MSYQPFDRPADHTPSCYEDLQRAAIEKRTWHDEPGDVTRLQEELRISVAHRARHTTLIDIAPWIARVAL